MSAPTETIERITTPAKVERHPGDVNIVETTRRQAVRLRELLFGNTIQYKDSVDRFLTKHEEDMNKSWRDRFQNVFLHRFNTHFLEVTASLQAESYICDAMFNAANNVHLKPGEEYMGSDASFYEVIDRTKKQKDHDTLEPGETGRMRVIAISGAEDNIDIVIPYRQYKTRTGELVWVQDEILEVYGDNENDETINDPKQGRDKYIYETLRSRGYETTKDPVRMADFGGNETPQFDESGTRQFEYLAGKQAVKLLASVTGAGAFYEGANLLKETGEAVAEAFKIKGTESKRINKKAKAEGKSEENKLPAEVLAEIIERYKHHRVWIFASLLTTVGGIVTEKALEHAGIVTVLLALPGTREAVLGATIAVTSALTLGLGIAQGIQLIAARREYRKEVKKIYNELVNVEPNEVVYND